MRAAGQQETLDPAWGIRREADVRKKKRTRPTEIVVPPTVGLGLLLCQINVHASLLRCFAQIAVKRRDR